MERCKSPAEGEGSNHSIHLQVVELRRLSEIYGSSSPTIFEPQTSSAGGGMEKRDSSTANSVSPTTGINPAAAAAPEKKLTLFALRLAVLEKAATSLGTLGFIWATVVLLGGFAIVLDKTDFWLITVILLIEGARIFSRSHELEWQHQATWSISYAGVNSFRALKSSSHFLADTVKTIFRPLQKQSRRNRGTESDPPGSGSGPASWHQQRKKSISRTWTSSDVPILPYGKWVFLSKNVSKVFYWLQLASATACVTLSLMKLIQHNYGDVSKTDTDKRNRKAALTIFYSLALSEALLFLLEKAYWEWKVIYCKILEQVNQECELGPSGMVSIKRFFYDAYSRSVNGSIFDGLKMDVVSFAMELLSSTSPDEQLIGAGVLRQFSVSERFSDDTLQKVGVNISVIERLVEMLNWKDLQEEEIRRSAAEVLSKLAGKKQNSLRVAGIPGAMESISSLLQTSREANGPAAADEVGEKKIAYDHHHFGYGFWTFNHLGLLILKKLARDHDNCGKIGNTRGLLPKIIDFTHAGEKLLKDENAAHTQILTVKRSLQVMKMLASTTGATGKQLRKEISEVVFTISNIRDILRDGRKHPMLQKLSIEILTSLALEEEATERIGGTGGILKELFNIFFDRDGSDQSHVRIAAGEALAMLALESRNNCHRILKLKVLGELVAALEVPVLRVNAGRIARNLCIYSGGDSFDLLKDVTACAPTVLRTIASEDKKLQEVMVGLAAEAFKFMTPQESTLVFERVGMTELELATIIVTTLRKYQDPPTKVPRIRRFCIELAIWMMRGNAAGIFRELGFGKDLESVLETTSELESFNIFSGTVGMSRHSISIHSLVETAMELLVRH